MWVIMNNIVSPFKQQLLQICLITGVFDNTRLLTEVSSEAILQNMHPQDPSSDLKNNTCNALGMYYYDPKSKCNYSQLNDR